MGKALLVPVSLPATPVVVIDAGFMGKVEALEASAQAMSAEALDLPKAAGLLREITRAGADLEVLRQTVVRPLLEAKAAIDKAASQPQQRLEAAKKAVKGAILSHEAKERARLEAEHRAEQERLRAEAKKKQEAAELAELLHEPDEETTEPPAPPAEPPDLAMEMPAAQPVVVKARGMHFRTTLEFEVEDLDKVPVEFVRRTLDAEALRRAHVRPWRDGQPLPTVPGILFKTNRQPVAR